MSLYLWLCFNICKPRNTEWQFSLPWPNSKCTVLLNIHKDRSPCSYIVSCFLWRCAVWPRHWAGRTALARASTIQQTSWEKLHGVNGGCTRPKGPGHPAEGLGVNYPPLGPLGHCSSPGGKAFQSSHAVYTLYSWWLLLHFILGIISCTQCTKVWLYRVQTVQPYWITVQLNLTSS